LSAFYPDILTAPLPISVVLQRVGNPTLTVCVRLVILGAFVKTGVGLLHGLNERFSRAATEHGRAMPRYLRPVLSLAIMSIAVFVASSIGIINLIGQGYRFSSYFFLLIFLLPMMTRGAWLTARNSPLGVT
jgi:uncharacterized membrane protein YkvI